MKMRVLGLFLLCLGAFPVQAANYQVDMAGAHAFIQFRIKHLGYSWLYGRFDRFDGKFSYDAKNPTASSVSVTIDIRSLNSNHAERDKHLRDARFFNVAQFPQAVFTSTAFKPINNGSSAILEGNLTLKGVTKPVQIQVEQVGAGPDPWGGMRIGFTGKTTITLKDFGFNVDLGPASTQAEILIDIEGVKK